VLAGPNGMGIGDIQGLRAEPSYGLDHLTKNSDSGADPA
jgi:hypothetical protein